MEFMRTIVLIMLIISLVQLVEITVRKISPIIYEALGVFLQFITYICAMLGIALLIIKRIYFSVHAVFYGLGVYLMLTLFLALR